MTREEAIDLLDNLIGFVEDNHGSDYDEALKVAIKALEQTWIPVSERLPENGNYLVTMADNDCKDVRYLEISWFNPITKWSLGNTDVVAWMPLPEPYKAESEDK